MAKIKVWIARDRDRFKETNLWTKEPKMDEREGFYRCIDGCINSVLLPSHYGLRPGEIREAELTIDKNKG